MTRHRLKASTAVTAAMVLMAVTAACSAAHPPLALSNGSVSDCFRALPLARTAVHDPSARFVGVKRVAADHIEEELPGTVMAPDDDTQVCALAFHGTFAAGQVAGAPSTEQGAYAVVIVTSRNLKLVRSFVGPELPTNFSHHLV